MKRWERIALAGLGAAAAALAMPHTVVAAAAKTKAPPPKNTIQCSAFKKLPDGMWHVETPTTFRIGRFRKTTFSDLSIGPHFYTFGGTDLYGAIERKCGARAGAATK